MKSNLVHVKYPPITLFERKKLVLKLNIFQLEQIKLAILDLSDFAFCLAVECAKHITTNSFDIDFRRIYALKMA